MRKPLLLFACVLLLLTITLYAYMYVLSGERLPSPEVLAQTALAGGSDAEKEKAALDLARSGEGAREHLRRVMAESNNPDVKAATVQGLGELRDEESVAAIIKLLNDPSEKVRGRAGVAVGNILGIDFRFRPDAPPAEREKVIKSVQKAYDDYRKNPPPRDPEAS
jgi:HEAT repeat protein